MAQDRDDNTTKSLSVDEQQQCPCQEGMKPDVDVGRRKLLFSAAAATAATSFVSGSAQAQEKKATPKAPPGAVLYDVPEDPTKEMGRGLLEDGGYGTRSQFDTAVRTKPDTKPSDNTSRTFTPLASMVGNLTRSGLHFERHHGGIPTIDPTRHQLYIHGLVDTAKKFTMAEIQNLP